MHPLHFDVREELIQSGESWENSKWKINIWPCSTSGFRNILEKYSAAHLTLCRYLTTLYAEILNLTADFFAPPFSRPGAIASLVHYAPRSSLSILYGLAAHTDIGCFTIVAQDVIPGLQVLNTAGEWLQVPPVPGMLVLNIGDMLVWSVSGMKRYAGVFFLGVDHGSTLETLDACFNGGSKYEPVVAGKFVFRRLTRNRLPLEAEA